jgi:uncharacterized protein (DUF1800 family)
MRGWWMGEMLATDAPLAERMTLFWHNHFVSSQQKVRVAKLMYRQNVTLRAHALGDFGALLHAASKDAAMLVYLDGVRNRRGAPNENFAREVMELFTLGEGRYSEQDIKQAARAFTGWSIDVDSGQYLFRPFLHDDGEKTVFGRTGRFDGDAVLDILLAQPATAEFIVSKLWREFVSPHPDEARVKQIAAQFRRNGWSIAQAVRALLMQPGLIARDEDNALVKSPAELMVGFVGNRTARSCNRSLLRWHWPGWDRTCSRRRTCAAGRAATPGLTRRRCWRASSFWSAHLRVPQRPSRRWKARWSRCGASQPTSSVRRAAVCRCSSGRRRCVSTPASG